MVICLFVVDYKMYSYSFEKLDVWKLSRKLAKDIYVLTKGFPNEEKFALVSQMQRASVSVVSNIAEGSTRTSYKEQIRYIEIAYGSLMELYSQLCISLDINLITSEIFETKNTEIKEISNKLNALKKAYQEKANSQITK